MMSAELASWQSNNRYRKEGDVVYGVYQGCGFTVSEEDGGKLFIFMLSARDDRAFDDFENALASAGGAVADGQVGDVESYLAVFFDESRGQLPSAIMDKIIDFTASQARQCGFRVPNTCVKCGARATKRSFVDNMVQPLCADCSARNKQNRKAASTAAPADSIIPPAAPINSTPPQQSDYHSQYANDQDDEYTQQYAPIVPDSSKYDDSYDEYAGMTSQYSNYNSNSNDNYNYNDNYNDNYNSNYDNDDNQDYSSPSPISFSDSGEDDYNAIMGNDEDYQSTTTEIGGKMSMGILGALAGSIVGVIPYLIVALVANFHMAALCFPAGMLAIVFYTMFGGRKLKGLGMGTSIGVSSVVSIITMFLAMSFSYINDTTNFSGAVSYLFSQQLTFFCINIVFATLGSVFGACFMVGVMANYVDVAPERSSKAKPNNKNTSDDPLYFN